MIKNVILDIGNVLVDFHPQETMRCMGYSEEEVQVLANATILNPIWNELDLGIQKEDDVIAQMRKFAAGYEEKFDHFFEYGKPDLVRLYDYSSDWVKQLKSSGYHVYLLSNYPVSFFEMHSKSTMPFIEDVDGMVVSGYVKMVKPDPDIYQFLLDKYHLTAEECIFFDDREENVEAAKSVGMHGAVFTNPKNAWKQLSSNR